MKKHYSKALCIASLCSVIIAGCTWHEDEYNKYVSDDGSIEKCPNDDVSGELLFIEVPNKNNSDPTIPKIIRCAETCTDKENCSNSEEDDPSCKIESCVPLTDSRCSDYAGSFEHKLCPKNTECLVWQTVNDYLYCSKPIIECHTANDCEGMDGWISGDCEENKCVAAECDTRYHLTDQNKCEDDTVDHCGTSRTKCSDLENTNALSFKCENSICVPFECQIGYHLSTQENGSTICEEDDVDSCGGINCSETYPGWNDGSCETKPNMNKVQCSAKQCKEGYHLTRYYLGSEDDTNDDDDFEYYLCEIDDDEHCGGAKNADNFESDLPVNCKTKIRESGVELYYCKKVEENDGSITSSCEIAKCADNYHWNRDNTVCELNDVSHCGSFNNDCLKVIPGGAEGAVHCSSTFSCYATACRDEYYPTEIKIEALSGYGLEVSSNASVQYYSDCTAYTNTSCGLDQNNNAIRCPNEAPLCSINNEGRYSCMVGCGSSMETCQDKIYDDHYYCADLNNDIYNCGSCGKQCKATDPNTQPLCSSASCSIECISGFLDCNDNMSDGCESSLRAFHLKECKVCEDGYGNCDGDWSNGCEIKLQDYGLKSCSVCADPYTNCGYINGTIIPLCLHGGKDTWTRTDQFATGDKRTNWGWGDRWSSDYGENQGRGGAINWDYIDNTDPQIHICQNLCNYDYGITAKPYPKDQKNDHDCYQKHYGKMYYQCNEKGNSIYWTTPKTCQPKQTCVLHHGDQQSFQTYCINE